VEEQLEQIEGFSFLMVSEFQDKIINKEVKTSNLQAFKSRLQAYTEDLKTY